MTCPAPDANAVAFVLVVCTLVLVVLVFFMSRNVQRVRSTTDDTLTHTQNIDHAVNGKAPGETSLSQDVTTIKDKQELDTPSVPDGSAAVLPTLTEIKEAVAAIRADLARHGYGSGES